MDRRISGLANKLQPSKAKIARETLVSSETVNARGLLCPLPVIRLQDAVKELPAGTEVELIGTDPGVLQDVPAWCRINGHTILEDWTDANEYHIKLKLGQ